MNHYPVQVISLTTATERRAIFEMHNAHMLYEFVDAVAGAELTEQAVLAAVTL